MWDDARPDMHLQKMYQPSRAIGIFARHDLRPDGSSKGKGGCASGVLIAGSNRIYQGRFFK